MLRRLKTVALLCATGLTLNSCAAFALGRKAPEPKIEWCTFYCASTYGECNLIAECIQKDGSTITRSSLELAQGIYIGSNLEDITEYRKFCVRRKD